MGGVRGLRGGQSRPGGHRQLRGNLHGGQLSALLLNNITCLASLRLKEFYIDLDKKSQLTFDQEELIYNVSRILQAEISTTVKAKNTRIYWSIE